MVHDCGSLSQMEAHTRFARRRDRIHLGRLYPYWDAVPLTRRSMSRHYKAGLLASGSDANTPSLPILARTVAMFLTLRGGA
jgi:hypothetical protein